MSKTVSERKQDSSSQTVPVEDKSDPPEGSEEVVESRTDTPEGKGGRLLALWVGHRLGQAGAGVGDGGRPGRQGSWCGASPGPTLRGELLVCAAHSIGGHSSALRSRPRFPTLPRWHR